MARKQGFKEGQNLVITKPALPGFGHLTPTVTWSIYRADNGNVKRVESCYLVDPLDGLDTALLYGLPTHIYGLSPCVAMSKRQVLLSIFCVWVGTRYGKQSSEPTGSFNMRRLLKPTQSELALHMCIASRYALHLSASKIWRIVQASVIWQRNS